MAPLKVTNDLLMAADDVMFRVLVLLDLSAAKVFLETKHFFCQSK